MYVSILLGIFYLSIEVLSMSLFSPCKIDDIECIEKSVNAAMPQIYAGNSELGIESMVPLKINEILGDLKELKFKFTNSTFTGGQNTVFTNLGLNEDFTNAKFSLIFNDISLFGQYEMTGKLFNLPIEGFGDYSFKADKYNITVDSQLDKVKGENGETHVSIKSFKLKCLPLSPVAYDFQNLFNGKKVLANAVHKFVNENWLEVTLFVQDPGWYAAIDKAIHVVNQYLQYIALDDIILN